MELEKRAVGLSGVRKEDFEFFKFAPAEKGGGGSQLVKIFYWFLSCLRACIDHFKIIQYKIWHTVVKKQTVTYDNLILFEDFLTEKKQSIPIKNSKIWGCDSMGTIHL